MEAVHCMIKTAAPTREQPTIRPLPPGNLEMWESLRADPRRADRVVAFFDDIAKSPEMRDYLAKAERFVRTLTASAGGRLLFENLVHNANIRLAPGLAADRLPYVAVEMSTEKTYHRQHVIIGYDGKDCTFDVYSVNDGRVEDRKFPKDPKQLAEALAKEHPGETLPTLKRELDYGIYKTSALLYELGKRVAESSQQNVSSQIDRDLRGLLAAGEKVKKRLFPKGLTHDECALVGIDEMPRRAPKK